MGQSTRMTAAVYLRDDMETPALPRHTATGQMLWQRSHPDGTVIALVFLAAKSREHILHCLHKSIHGMNAPEPTKRQLEELDGKYRV